MGKINPFLLAFLLIFFLCCVAAICVLTVLYIQEKTSKNNSTLPTAIPTSSANNPVLGRSQASEFLRQSLNYAIDPCDDFYAFACGNWSSNNVIPRGRRQYDTLTKLQDDVYEKTYLGLQKVDISSNAKTLKALQKLRQIFDSCTNMVETDRRAQQMENPLVKLLQSSAIGMWPILQIGWSPNQMKISPEQLAGVLAAQYGVNTFLTPDVSVDWKDVTKHRLYLDEAELTLGSRAFYVNTSFASILREYADTIQAAAQIIANDINGFVPVLLRAEVNDIVSFEMNLAEIMTDTNDIQYQKLYNPYNSVELKIAFPSYHWSAYFASLLPINLHHSQQTGPLSKVILLNPGYVEKLTELLERTPVKTVFNYLIWRLIYERMWVLSIQYRDLHRSLQETLDITREAPPQSMQCVTLLTEMAGFAIGRLFVDNNFDQSQRSYASHVISEVISAQKSILQNATWMDPVTKAKAIDKANSILANTGYPNWILNDTLLNGFYSNLNINNDRNQLFFDVYNNLTAWHGLKRAEKLFEPAIRSEYFGISPAEANAWYSPEYNSVTVPAGILQSPVFQINYPVSLQFGILGTIIGHELSHGFDIQGVQFGPNGSLTNWFDQYSIRHYQQKEQCLIKEYSNYCYQQLGLCVNGRQTLGENMADQSGLRAAHVAFKNYVTKYGQGPRLPKLEKFTAEQLFFVSYARLWCGVADNDAIKNQLMLNPHPPDKVRVLGALKNSEHFAKAFKCSRSSNMVSKDPC